MICHTVLLYLSSGKVLSIFLFTCGRKKHDVINRLDQLQLHNAFNQQS